MELSARGYIAAATGDVEGIFKHTKGALALNRRTQAVVKAKELGLV